MTLLRMLNIVGKLDELKLAEKSELITEAWDAGGKFLAERVSNKVAWDELFKLESAKIFINWVCVTGSIWFLTRRLINEDWLIIGKLGWVKILMKRDEVKEPKLLLANIWMSDEALDGGRFVLDMKLISEIWEESDKLPFDRIEINELAEFEPIKFCDKMFKRFVCDVDESWLLERIFCKAYIELSLRIPIKNENVINGVIVVEAEVVNSDILKGDRVVNDIVVGDLVVVDKVGDNKVEGTVVVDKEVEGAVVVDNKVEGAVVVDEEFEGINEVLPA